MACHVMDILYISQIENECNCATLSLQNIFNIKIGKKESNFYNSTLKLFRHGQ